MSYNNRVSELIEQCRTEHNINKKIEILYYINSRLPKSRQLNMPSLLTDDYVNSALNNIEASQTIL
jgi:hypothetical protein